MPDGTKDETSEPLGTRSCVSAIPRSGALCVLSQYCIVARRVARVSHCDRIGSCARRSSHDVSMLSLLLLAAPAFLPQVR